MNRKIKKLCFSVLLLLLCTIVSIVSVKEVKAIEYNENVFDVVIDEAESLTQTDLLDGLTDDDLVDVEIGDEKVSPDITDFKTYITSKDLTTSISSDVKKCLENIVPLCLTYTPGSWYYEGEEYSFYIETKEKQTLDDVDIDEDHIDFEMVSYFVSEVVIIDYDFGFNDSQEVISSSIDIFSRTFIWGLDINDNYSIVIHKKPNTDYLLKNVGFVHECWNEHSSNLGDINYDINEDLGPIIRATQLSFSGAMERSDFDQFTEMSKETLLFAIGQIPVLGTISSILDSAGKLVSIGDSDYIAVDYNKGATIDVGLTKSQQREEGVYTKIIHTAPFAIDMPSNAASLNKDLYINNNATFTSIFDDSLIEFRAKQTIVFNLCKSDSLSREYFYITKSGELIKDDGVICVDKFLKTSEKVMAEKKQILEIGENQGYLLKGDSEQDFSFIPKYNGTYTFDVDNNKVVSFIHNDVVETFTESFSKELKDGEEYYLKVKCVTDDNYPCIYNIGVAFSPNMALCGTNDLKFVSSSHEFLTIDFLEHAYYRFAITEEKCWLSLLDENFVIIDENTKEISIKLEGKKYYLKISSLEKLDCTISVKCTKEKKVSFVTNKEQTLNDYIYVSGSPIVLPNPNVPPGENFLGWWDNPDCFGEKITMYNIDNLNYADITLYAKWEYIVYKVIYHVNGGNAIETGYYNIVSGYNLYDSPTKEGCVFLGWYDLPDFSGETVTSIPIGSIGDKEFYAKWVYEKYNVFFSLDTTLVDRQEIVLESDQGIFYEDITQVNYGEIFVLPIAKTAGFTFLGWYNDDEQITMENGVAFSHYTYEHDIEVYPKWSKNSYIFKLWLNEENEYYFLPDGSLMNVGDVTTEDIFVEYKGLCINCLMSELINNSETSEFVLGNLYKPGKKYQYLIYNENDSSSIACWDTWCVDAPNGAEIVVYPHYVDEQYTLKFMRPDSKYFNLNNTEYEALPLFVEKNYKYRDEIVYPSDYSNFFWLDGIDFKYWAIDGEEPFNNQYISDLTVNYESDVTAVLVAIFDVEVYKITYGMDGGQFYTEDISLVVEEFTIFDEITLINPYKQYNVFGGWYADNVRIEKIARHTAKNINLVAEWNPYVYKVKYVLLDNSNEIKSSYEQSFIYGQNQLLEKCSFVKIGHTFSGWSLSPNGLIEYKDEQDVLNLTDKNGVTIEFYSVWKANRYNIICKNLMEYMTPSVKKYTYGEGLSTMPKLYRSDSTGADMTLEEIDMVYGWYEDISFTKQITSISSTAIGDVTIYAKYDYWLCEKDLEGSYTIDSKVESSPVIELGVYMGLYYDQAKTTTLNKIKIRLTFYYWEEDDGNQQLYVYEGSKVVDQITIDRTESVDDDGYNEDRTFLLDIDDYQDTNILYLKFGVTGWWGNTWHIENIHVEAWLVN